MKLVACRVAVFFSFQKFEIALKAKLDCGSHSDSIHKPHTAATNKRGESDTYFWNDVNLYIYACLLLEGFV